MPGSEKGWIDARHRAYGSPALLSNPARENYWRTHLKEGPFRLDTEARQITLHALASVCAHRGWIANALHVRTTHVHCVVSGEATPERMLSDFKAYATRALRNAMPHPPRQRYWANHGSTRYLWNETSLRAAIDYVLNGQGEKMARYPE